MSFLLACFAASTRATPGNMHILQNTSARHLQTKWKLHCKRFPTQEGLVFGRLLLGRQDNYKKATNFWDPFLINPYVPAIMGCMSHPNIYVSIYIYVYIYIHTYTCACTSIYTYIYTYLYIYISIYIHIYIYIYTCIFKFPWLKIVWFVSIFPLPGAAGALRQPVSHRARGPGVLTPRHIGGRGGELATSFGW